MRKLNQSQPLLINCMEAYLEYLEKDNVPVHTHEVKNKAYINKVDRHFRYFLEALKLHNVDVEKLKFEDIDNQLIGHLHKYLEEIKNFGSSTCNAIIHSLKKFSEYIIRLYYTRYKNPFSTITKKPTLLSSIDKSEFERILEIITPENSYYQTPKGEKNFYQPWLKDAYWLSLLTPLRKNRIINLKWSNIKIGIEDELTPQRYYCSNFIKLNTNYELECKLYEMGFEEFKNTNNYILAPNNVSRKTMADLLSKSFAHYTKLLGINKDFKCLRRTFILNFLDARNYDELMGVYKGNGVYINKAFLKKGKGSSYE